MTEPITFRDPQTGQSRIAVGTAAGLVSTLTIAFIAWFATRPITYIPPRHSAAAPAGASFLVLVVTVALCSFVSLA